MLGAGDEARKLIPSVLLTLGGHMNTIKGSLRILGVLLLTACDPQGPGASGIIELSPSVETTRFGWLEVRVYPDDGESFSADSVPLDGPVG